MSSQQTMEDDRARLLAGARYAIAHPDRVSRLVLVGAGSLARFRPAPGVALALIRFLARPNERTQRASSARSWWTRPARGR